MPESAEPRIIKRIIGLWRRKLNDRSLTAGRRYNQRKCACWPIINFRDRISRQNSREIVVRNGRRDYFVSYTNEDQEWAEWIAWYLENVGYTTIVQAWDFNAGNNFIIEMHDSLNRADRLLAVLSPDYLKSGFATAEWAATLGKDPNRVSMM